MPGERNLSNHGADDTGLISGYAFLPGEPQRALESATLAKSLAELRARPEGDGRFLWLHFNLAHAATERWLERHAGLSPAFFDALRDELRSTRIERVEDALLAVVNDVRFDFSFTRWSAPCWHSPSWRAGSPSAGEARTEPAATRRPRGGGDPRR